MKFLKKRIRDKIAQKVDNLGLNVEGMFKKLNLSIETKEIPGESQKFSGSK